MAPRPPVNPTVLRWAREQAQLSLEEAAARAHVPTTKKADAGTRLAEWESGSKGPTQRQLERLATAYRRPLALFFMTKPPRAADPIADFRTLPATDRGELSPEFSALLRQIRASQREVRALHVEDELEPLPFVGSGKKDSALKLAERIRTDLSISLDEQVHQPVGELFKFLRERAETAGIYVLLAGNLGSHHTAISPDEFRGFTLADDVAPFVVLNPNDARAALVFTLVHELAHLWRGEDAISNTNPFASDASAAETERLCDDVAGEFLMPEDLVLERWQSLLAEPVRPAVERIARSFGVSHSAAACRLWKLEHLSDDEWWTLFDVYKKRWNERREKQRQSKGGPNYYVVRNYQLGEPLIRTVLTAVDSGDISATRAGRVLRLKPTQLKAIQALAAG